jgi:predicted alpha-1,2-mannosidase
VTTQLTVTPRSGMASFTFPSTTQANLIFKLNGSANGDSNTQFNVVSSTEVSGQVTSGGFCGASNSYTVYFDMVFNTPFATDGTQAVKSTAQGADDDRRVQELRRGAEQADAARLGPDHEVQAKSDAVTPQASANDGYVTFNTTSNQTVLAKIGVSYVSTANATQNRTTENPNWNFSATQAAAHTAWNNVLDRVDVAGGTSAQQTVFYTALYHASLHPNLISDVNGQYPGFNGSVETVDSGHSAEYANYSGWDIYRSQAQLEGLIDPQVASDTAQSMLDDYTQTGQFPKWSEDNGETYVMVGDPADEIIADYYAFGATDFSTSSALTDMLAEATTPNNDRPGLTYLEQIGYLPSNGSYGCCNFYGPTATTLEYDSADFAISSLAGSLGDTTRPDGAGQPRAGLAEPLRLQQRIHPAARLPGQLDLGLQPDLDEQLRRGGRVELHADGPVQHPRPGHGDGRQLDAQHVPQHRALLVHRRQRVHRPRQRARPRDPLGVRLHR